MNNKNLLNAMSYIDDSLIEEAVQDYKKPKKKLTYLSLAACFMLIIGLALPIVIYRFVSPPDSTIETSPTGTQTDTGDTPDIPDTPSETNILKEHLVFVKPGIGSATVYHISDKSVKYTLEKLSYSSENDMSFSDWINTEYGATHTPIDLSKLNLTVNGESVNNIPKEKGTYEISMNFDSVNAHEKEIIIRYYFEAQGYTLQK